MRELPVETVVAMTPTEFHEYVQSNRPVLMRGTFASAQLRDAWSERNVRSRIGSRRVPVEVSASGDFFGGMQHEDAGRKRMVEMTCDELFDRLRGDGGYAPVLARGERYYARSTPLEAYAPLDTELGVPDIIDDARYGAVHRQIFISGPGHTTPAHTDCWIDNLFVHVAGRKRVFIWSPDQAELLAIRPFGEIHSRQSALDPLDPDLERFPGFASAQAQLAMLEPGDALYIPEGWVHHITTGELSISVSCKFNHKGAFQDALLSVAGYLATARPELRAQYLHLLRWPASILSEQIGG